MMWTNVFKLGGLNQISWFQFLPHEFDFSTHPDKRCSRAIYYGRIWNYLKRM